MWEHPVCKDFESARDYAKEWLGTWSNFCPNKVNEVNDYSGCGDTIEIREVEIIGKENMSFLCLGVIEFQYDFFEKELKRVFGEKVGRIDIVRFEWSEERVCVCEADIKIHSEIKAFVTGFTSGFKSAI